MTSLAPVLLEAADPASAEAFTAALGVADAVGVRFSDAPTSGFRGFTLSLVVTGPATVDALLGAALLGAALAGGATALKPAAKSFRGYGGVVRAPDGSIWKVATSSSPVGLALYGRRALARDAGVPEDGTGSDRLVIGGDTGSFTDPDGFVPETTPDRAAG